MRASISRAALLVKVIAQTLSLPPPTAKKWATRLVRVLVLPVPAPATIKRGVSAGARAAFCCSGFKLVLGGSLCEVVMVKSPYFSRVFHGFFIIILEKTG